MNFDLEMIMEMMAEYIEGEIEGHDPEIFSQVERFFNEFQEEIMRDKKYYLTCRKVLDGFQPTPYSELNKKRVKELNKVPKIDVAWVSANVGFYFGMVCAENMRLHFYERKVCLENFDYEGYGGDEYGDDEDL